jgi:hypothetical protein
MQGVTKLILDMSGKELRAVLLQLAEAHHDEVVAEITAVLDITRKP